MELISIEQTAALLRGAEDVLILTHIRPDGDTAGSACALCLGLRALGKTAYLAENPPSMHRYDKYTLPYFAPAGFAPGFIAAVDIASAGQYPPGSEALAVKTDLAIDHHGTNGGYAKRTLLDDHAAAAGELVYLVLRQLCVPMSPEISEALYTALATDTNGFRTAGTTGRTLRIAGDLHDAGFDVYDLTRRLFETKSAARLRLEAALFGAMRFPLPGVCVMTLPYETITACGAGEDDMDKLSTVAMAPEGVRAGVLLRQLPDPPKALPADGRLPTRRAYHAPGRRGRAPGRRRRRRGGGPRGDRGRDPRGI